MDELHGQKKASVWYVYLLSFVAALGGFLFGYDLALISGAIIFLEKHFQLTAITKGFAASSAILGCLAGPILGLWFADYFGRRKTLFIAAIFLMVSAIGSAVAPTLIWFNIWRWVGGVGVGLASVVSPIYIAEIAPAHLRGRLVTINQLAIVVGICISILVDYWLSFGEHWRWMFGAEAFPVVFFVIALCFIPNSPRWLAIKSRFDEAKSILTTINGHHQAEKELAAIQVELNQESGSFRELFQPGIRKALLIGLILMFYGQIIGVNMLHLYAPSILLEIGIGSPSKAILNALYIDLFMFICVLIAFWTIARFSRRTNWYIGFVLIAVGHLVAALSIQHHWAPIFVLMGLIIGIGTHQFSTGPLPFVINSEIYPNRIRGKAMSLALLSMYIGNYIGSTIFPTMMEWCEKQFGSASAIFYFFICICGSGILFVWRFLPETKDLSLEEISSFWLKYDSDSK